MEAVDQVCSQRHQRAGHSRGLAARWAFGPEWPDRCRHCRCSNPGIESPARTNGLSDCILPPGQRHTGQIRPAARGRSRRSAPDIGPRIRRHVTRHGHKAALSKPVATKRDHVVSDQASNTQTRIGQNPTTPQRQARSEYSMVSVFTTIISSCPTKGGTMTLTPLSSTAGLNELAAVWPLTTGSVSTI